jgi:PAS domain S-box-containing protein
MNPSGAPSPSTDANTPATVSLERFVASVTDYAIYVLTVDGHVATWNAGAQRFKQYSAAEITGKHFSCFYTPEDQQSGKPARALAIAAESGKYEEEGWRMRKDGTRFFASVVIDAVRDDNGTLIGYTKITRDVTERQAAQAELRASEERFRLLVQGVTDYAIYMLAPDGTITNWNAGAQRIKGFSAAEVVGTNFSRFYTEEDRLSGLPQKALATARAEGRVESEGWRVRKDGTRFWSHVVIDPIYADGGQLMGFAKITRDNTERRNANETLERTREALFQSQKLEAIGKLTGGIAHDFNNLLGVIVSGAELLSAELKSAQSQKVLASIQRAAGRGATLTQQLLSFARQQPLVQDDYNLNNVIEQFEAILRRAAGDGVALELALLEDTALVHIDAAQFEAAVLNLVSNARDAMPYGGALRIETGVVALREGQVSGAPEGRYVRLAITDTGTGMSPAVAARAIEPFFTTKPVGKGTGLGLSQAYGLVQQSGGAFHIDSEAGIGTTITMYFPALVAREGQVGASTDPNAGNDKALVVDDQPEVLEIAVALFKSLGYDVLSANSGEEALAILRRTGAIDVLVSDVVMPGMSGYDLGLEAMQLHPALKILLVSGYAEPELQTRIADTARFQLLTKPYRLADVLKKLRQAG